MDAQDRFFLMDLRRHVTAGRLAELVGDDPDAIASDKVVRTLGWRRVAVGGVGACSTTPPGAVPAGLRGRRERLPGDPHARTPSAIEYAVLGTQVDVGEPEPWDPVDSLAWLKAMAWDLRSNDRDELATGPGLRRGAATSRWTTELFPPGSASPPIVGRRRGADGAETTST